MSPKNLFKYSFQSTQVFTGVTNPKDGQNLEVEKFFLKIKRVTKFFKKWDACTFVCRVVKTVPITRTDETQLRSFAKII